MISWIIASVMKGDENAYKLNKKQQKLLDIIITFGVLWDVWVVFTVGLSKAKEYLYIEIFITKSFEDFTQLYEIGHFYFFYYIYTPLICVIIGIGIYIFSQKQTWMAIISTKKSIGKILQVFTGIEFCILGYFFVLLVLYMFTKIKWSS